MGVAAYPVGNDLSDYITSLGVLNAADAAAQLAAMSLDVKALSAKRAWERATGWTPFLGDAEDVTRYFDPPGPNDTGRTRGGGKSLDLEGGLITLTGLYAGYSADDPGDLLTEGTDFDLYPYNAVAEGKPYTHVEFYSRIWGAPRSVKIIGRWGYQAELPEDAYTAILHYGVYLCYPELSSLVTKGVAALKTVYGEVRYDGAKGPLALAAEGWKTAFFEKAAEYRRLTL